MSKTDAAAMEGFFAGVGAKDRQNVEKHLAACEAEGAPGHADLWRRIAVEIRRLAPLALQTVGQRAVQFYIADGKYRMQVFALEDQRDGNLIVYLPDVLAEAIKTRVLAPLSGSRGGEDEGPVEYRIPGHDETLHVDAMDSSNTPDPAPHAKHMMGWNRKALRVTLRTAPTPATKVEAETVIDLCKLAARAWAPKAGAAPAAPAPAEKPAPEKVPAPAKSVPAPAKSAPAAKTPVKAAGEPARRKAAPARESTPAARRGRTSS